MNTTFCFVCSTYSLVLYANISAILVHAPMPVSKVPPSYRPDRLPLANSNNLKILPGQPVLQLLTVDLDEENTPNSRVLYFLVSQKPLLKESGFEIDRDSGEIRLLGCLDYEVMWILF